MFAVFENQLTMAVCRPIARDANVQVAIRARIDQRIETKNRCKCVPSIHDYARSPDVITPQKLQTMILLDARLVRRQQVRSVGGNQSKVAVNKRALGMSIEAPPAGLERIW